MSEVKKATTYEEQMALLKSRGLRITDEEACLRKLSLINYYRLTAYLIPFKDDATGNYVQGASFDKIYSIYEFDRKLRNTIFGALEVIEISLRTRVSYFHAHKYGSLGYLNDINFNSDHDGTDFKRKIYTEIKRNKENPFVKHHLNNYGGNFPIWVIVELFSFGMLSRLYSDLKTGDQKRIAAEYDVNYKVFRSWLKCLTDLRNVCAHYGRLHNNTFPASPANIKLPEDEKRKLWSYLTILKLVYPDSDKWNGEFLPALKNLFAEYKDYINLYHMAFPEDWSEQLQK